MYVCMCILYLQIKKEFEKYSVKKRYLAEPLLFTTKQFIYVQDLKERFVLNFISNMDHRYENLCVVKYQRIQTIYTYIPEGTG